MRNALPGCYLSLRYRQTKECTGFDLPCSNNNYKLRYHTRLYTHSSSRKMESISTQLPAQNEQHINRQIVNIAAYKFLTLTDLPQRRQALRELSQQWDLKGTILLSPEGINLFLAGSRDAIDRFVTTLRSESQFEDLIVKESLNNYQPFNRLLVRIKKEIIAFGVEGVDPRVQTAPKISAQQLKQLLDDEVPLTLLDTRNDYEIKLGTFEGAVDLKIKHFREFPQAVQSLKPELKQQPIVMFCTGGIRCEKAGPFLQQAGFENVLQLDGGILKYFEECQGAHWQGECFVFDQRVGLNPLLEETETTQCYACQEPLTAEEQQSVHYVMGVSCPYCHEDPARQMRSTIQHRHEAIKLATTPLPGSVPYDNRRPMNVPQQYDQQTLIDYLADYFPRIARETWQATCEAGRILDKNQPAAAGTTVRAGQRFWHLQPATQEPDVNVDIQVTYEDDYIVAVNKPAPLPMHPCGRFNRNTLLSILNTAYEPERLRPAHRLDANTSGIVIFSRTKAVAQVVQPQFDQHQISKTYLARVQGVPEVETFASHRHISAEKSTAGSRLPADKGLPAETHFTVLQRLDDETTLIECKPITGRTNQIRVHLWDLGLPIFGDPIYLPDKRLGEMQTLSVADPPMCLHAWKLKMTHPATDKPITLTAAAPAWAEVRRYSS